MANGWTKNKLCPICGGAGWGKNKCRGFEHRDGGAVYCEHPNLFWSGQADYSLWEKTDIVISPFGIPLTCFRRVL